MGRACHYIETSRLEYKKATHSHSHTYYTDMRYESTQSVNKLINPSLAINRSVPK